MTSKKNKKADKPAAEATAEQPFVSHLVELRDRLLRVVLFMAVIFVILISFLNEVANFYFTDLEQQLPERSFLQSTQFLGPVWIPIKLVMYLTLLLGVPVILHQIWRFVTPGLYENERKLAFPFVISSTLLFYAGMVFAYMVVLPLIYWFLSEFSADGLASWNPDIGDFLSTSFKLMLAFGIAFQVPIFVILMCWTGISTPQSLAEKRRYVIVGCFVFGMLLTPPDPMSQTLLAVPMWLLFEAGVAIARVFLRKREAAAKLAEQEEAAAESDEEDLSEEEMDAELDKAIAEEEKINKTDT